MNTTNTNTVRLSKDSNWVRFEATQGLNTATIHNSAGEAVTVSATEARTRIATLVAAGWRVA